MWLAQRQRRRERLRGEDLPELYPELRRGHGISFWDDELRMDLAQERELAKLERRAGRVKEYLAREIAWKRMTVPLTDKGPSRI
jgi:hypothetical protein